MTAVPPPPPPPAGAAPMLNPAEAKNGLGVWALVLGIVSIVCGLGLLAGVPAIILGNNSKKAQQQGVATNGNLGNVGMILGIVGSVLVTLAWIIWGVSLVALVSTGSTY